MKFKLILWVLFSAHSLHSQISEMIDFHKQFEEQTLNDKLFKHADIMSLVDICGEHSEIETFLLGQSMEGRDIRMLKIGTGKRNILMWSQMHGDEPTATMALFDMINFLIDTTVWHEWKKPLLDELSIYIIPMLNPDGAEVYKRRNSVDIDLNRDALNLVTSEAQILKRVGEELKPVFGFNLHDQSPHYSVGNSGIQTRIAFLAPAYMTYKDSLNDNRANAMRLIGQMDQALQEIIPGEIARFNDTYEPNAFGDLFQSMGISTILIESGGSILNHHKQYNRKIHFALFLQALKNIAHKSYLYEGLQPYFNIPPNRRNAFDVVLRNVPLIENGRIIEKNVGINCTEFYYNQYRNAVYSYLVSDIGTLTNKIGFLEIDLQGINPTMGKIFVPGIDFSFQTNVIDIIKKGYTTIKSNGQNSYLLSNSPFSYYFSEITGKEKWLFKPFDFYFERNNIQYVFMNGRLYTIQELESIYQQLTLDDLLMN
jgi:hypothetical protein